MYNGSEMIGRPTVRLPEYVDEICVHIAHGGSLVDWCAQDGKPGYSTIMRWIDEDAPFRDKYTRAQEAQGDYFADKIVTTAENCELDPVAIQKARLEIDSYKWAAGKRKPKVYGDKLNVESQGAVEVRVSYATPEKTSLDK